MKSKQLLQVVLLLVVVHLALSAAVSYQVKTKNLNDDQVFQFSLLSVAVNVVLAVLLLKLLKLF
jgi:hypothetical protein